MGRLRFYVALLVTFQLSQTVWAESCPICQTLDAAYDKIIPGLKQQSFPAAIDDVKLDCISTPDRKNAIGAIQRMRVKASLKAVAAVLDNFADYAELFPDLVKVEAIPQSTPDKILVRWTEEAPTFFMRNLVHDLMYKIKDEGAKGKIYRYNLAASKYLNYSDGLIVLRPGANENETLFLEIDFYDADWSLLKILGSNEIWSNNLEQIYLSDLAVKIKAEQPALESKKARKEAKHKLDDKTLRQCLDNKKPLSEKALLDELHVAPAP